MRIRRDSKRGSPSPEGWRLIWRSLGEQWKGIALGVTAGIIWALAKASVPLLVRDAIDNGITPKDTAALWRWTAAIFVCGLIAALFTGIRRYSAFRESRLVEQKLRDRVFAHTQRLHFSYHDRQQTGELMSRANTDLFQIQNFVVLIPLTISNFITVVFVTVVLLFVSPVLTLLALGSLPVLNYLGKRFSTKLHPSVMAIQSESAELATVVEETVSGVRVVKGFGSQAAQTKRLTKEADDIYDVSMEAAQVRARYLPAMDLLPTVGFIMVLGYGGYQVLNGTLTVGDMVAFTTYIGLLIWPLRMLGMIIAQSQRGAASAQRVHEVLATDPQISSPRDSKPLPSGSAQLGAIELDDVVFRYEAGADAAVLDHLDLRIQPGESVALVGATGSGKSTVARLLPRFYDVQAGSVRLDGIDVRELDLLALRRAIGIVFEDTFLFSASIADNIAFADPLAKDDAIERAGRLSGAHDFIVDLPDGYATEIGERGFSLSGGQRQRIAIARAILADPRVLILDDATSSVDPTKEHEIRDALMEVMRGRTTIVIAHRPATIALADRVVLLHEGKVRVEGTHDELLRTSADYREVLAAAEAYDAERARHEDDHELEESLT